MSFRSGQKVECINDVAYNSIFGWSNSERPIKGAIYTIKRVYTFHNILCLWLEEITRDQTSIADHGPNVGYGAYRFRPLISRPTDISIFTAMLGPRVKETLDV